MPGHIECFRSGGKDAGLRVLAVQQFSKDSRVEIWRGSHLQNLPTTAGIRSLHETTRLELEKAGCIPELKEFKSGGLSVSLFLLVVAYLANATSGSFETLEHTPKPWRDMQ